jgi:hypothetical protein
MGMSRSASRTENPDGEGTLGAALVAVCDEQLARAGAQKEVVP